MSSNHRSRRIRYNFRVITMIVHCWWTFVSNAFSSVYCRRFRSFEPDQKKNGSSVRFAAGLNRIEPVDRRGVCRGAGMWDWDSMLWLGPHDKDNDNYPGPCLDWGSIDLPLSVETCVVNTTELCLFALSGKTWRLEQQLFYNFFVWERMKIPLLPPHEEKWIVQRPKGYKILLVHS